MQFKAISPFIIIKTPKQEEIERREKIGEIYIHPTFVWMTRNTQNGEIVSLSPYAKKVMPKANEGDLLICHHFVQGSMSTNESGKRFLVHEDETYNYYKVTAMEYQGQNNQAYGFYNGSELIPHKDYVFLEMEQPVLDEPANSIIHTGNYIETAEDIIAKTETIKGEITSLTKSKMNDAVKNEIIKREKEQSLISKKMHKKEYSPYILAAENEQLKIPVGTMVWVWNIACNTSFDFLSKPLRVVEKKYISAV